MKVKFLFAWYDLWVGVFIDKIKWKIYILPVPCLGICINLLPDGFVIKSTYSTWCNGGDKKTYILYDKDGDQRGSFVSKLEVWMYAHRLNIVSTRK